MMGVWAYIASLLCYLVTQPSHQPSKKPGKKKKKKYFLIQGQEKKKKKPHELFLRSYPRALPK